MKQKKIYEHRNMYKYWKKILEFHGINYNYEMIEEILKQNEDNYINHNSNIIIGLNYHIIKIKRRKKIYNNNSNK
jgi:hypothetical protein